MSKRNNVPAVTEAAQRAGMIAKAFTRLETEAKRIDSEERVKRSLTIVSAGDHFQMSFRAGKTTVQIQDDIVAVDVGG
ncbi:MAG TPA: hypothetical protein VFF88_00975 [Methylocella sp.]|nr:hypothetical protein [Methylocella sp.]